ncbi:GRP family sugar transporter, partial [Bacillus sp. B-TM1]
MDIFLAILPAIFWGSIVLFNVKLGGGPYSQTLGTTLGALIFSIIGSGVFMKPGSVLDYSGSSNMAIL